MTSLTDHEAEFTGNGNCGNCNAELVTMLDEADRGWKVCPACSLDIPDHIRELIFGAE